MARRQHMNQYAGGGGRAAWGANQGGYDGYQAARQGQTQSAENVIKRGGYGGGGGGGMRAAQYTSSDAVVGGEGGGGGAGGDRASQYTSL